MTVLVVKDALREGVHALHRIQQRRQTADGRPEILFLIPSSRGTGSLLGAPRGHGRVGRSDRWAHRG